MTNSSPLFLAIEGPDGTGKTGLTRALVRYYTQTKVARPAVSFRDPGSTELGEFLRPFLKNPDRAKLDPAAEVLLFNAMKHQLVSEKILPALEAGKVVITDRFMLSTCVYQGFLPGLNMVNFLGLLRATQPMPPSAYIVLQADLEELQRRRKGRGLPPDAYESDATMPRLVQGFQFPEMWTTQPVITIDTTGKSKARVLFDALAGIRQACPDSADAKEPVLSLDDLQQYEEALFGEAG